MSRKEPKTVADYRSLTTAAEIEFIERKSRFLGYARPLDSREAAEAFLSEIRAEYPDATHHVSAWRIMKGGFYQRYSDDGEPQGTAGLPVLDVIEKNDLTDCGIIVVRYFGGILLGAGGLVRAYSTAASLAVEKAGITLYQERMRYRILVDYSLAETVQYQLNEREVLQEEPTYGMDVEWVFAPPPGEEDNILALIADLTSGGALIEPLEKGYTGFPLP